MLDYTNNVNFWGSGIRSNFIYNMGYAIKYSDNSGERKVKIRTNFVTNSSSSNFIIACNGPLTKEKLLGLFGVPAGSPFYKRAEELSVQIIGASERIDETYLERGRTRREKDIFTETIANYYLKHSKFNHVYYISVWKEHIDIMEGFEPFLTTDDLVIIGEENWFMADRPMPEE